MSTAVALAAALDDLRSLSLAQVLTLLEGFGEPRLGKYGSGWVCSVEMTVAVAGASYKICSEFKHATPLAAALQCAERVRAALQSRDAGRLA
jgi:hypothetical protein